MDLASRFSNNTLSSREIWVLSDPHSRFCENEFEQVYCCRHWIPHKRPKQAVFIWDICSDLGDLDALWYMIHQLFGLFSKRNTRRHVLRKKLLR